MTFPNTLDTQMTELDCHALCVDRGVEHSLPAAVLVVDGGRRDEVVGVAPGQLRVVCDTTNNHHCGSLVSDYLYLGEGCLLCTALW